MYSQLLAALFVVARLLTSSSMISSSVSTLTETSTSICREVFDWVMVWMGGCSLIEALIGIILVSQLVYLLILDDMDPFASSTSQDQINESGGGPEELNSFTSLNKAGSGASMGKDSSKDKSDKKGSLAGSDDLHGFLPQDANTALSKMHDCSALWTQPPTFQDKNGLAVWHRPIGAAVHEFKFTVDINSEPAPVHAHTQIISSLFKIQQDNFCLSGLFLSCFSTLLYKSKVFFVFQVDSNLSLSKQPLPSCLMMISCLSLCL